jgi:hypothetical protein
MEDYSQLNIKPLTRRAINKLKKGGMIRVNAGDVPVHMSRSKMEQLAKKLSKGKGMNMSLTPEEIQMNGEGIFKSVRKGVNRLAKKTGDYLKSTQFRKDLVNVARPTLKGVAKAGIGSLAASAIATNPELAPLIVPAAYAATYGADKLIDNPSLITGNKTYDKGGMILPMRKPSVPRVPRIPKMPKPMGSDPITYNPKKDTTEYVGNGIYAGQHSSGYGIYAGGQVMMTGRHSVRDVLASPDPLHTQHHNQMLKQFM